MRSTRLGIAALGVALATAVLTPAASADTINIASDMSNSESMLGAFTGTVTWNYSALDPSGTLTVSLTNTSPLANGGFITAFAFNFAMSEAFNVSLAAPNSPADNFGLIGGGALNAGDTPVSAPPFGDFVAGASTSNSWTGGGPPSNGLGVGDTGTFVFTIAGGAGDLGALSASSFVETTSIGGQTVSDYGFVVRYRGFEDGGSDKVPAGQIVVPIPAPAVLAGLGLLGVVVCRMRRR